MLQVEVLSSVGTAEFGYQIMLKVIVYKEAKSN